MTVMDSSRVWFITGASSGLGRALADAALMRGDRVVAGVRNPARVDDLRDRHPDRLTALRMDVTDPEQVRTAVASGAHAYGRLDVVANFAGYGSFGALEELSDDELRRQIETNLYGVLNVTRAALPLLRRQRSGHLLQMSSLSGVAPLRAGESIYAATKFAVEGLSEVVSNEVSHLGIKVTILEPGPVRTNFGTAASVTPVTLADYQPTVGAALEWFSQLAGNQPNDPSRTAEAILQLVEADDPPLRLPIGTEAVTAIRAKLQSQTKELDAWEHLGAAS
jgi:NAD(P)-dependent dehydrogenase (short-subunit alcohol dehydrogenase family)